MSRNLNSNELEKLPRYTPLLDNIEGVIKNYPALHSEAKKYSSAISESINLQIDAGYLHEVDMGYITEEDIKGRRPVTKQRLDTVLKELYDCYSTTKHHKYKNEFKEMLGDLGINIPLNIRRL